MKSQNQIYLFSFLLILASLSLITYKINILGFPLFQDQTENIWNIEAKVTFKGKDEPAKLSLSLPSKQDGFIIVNEESSSENYGYSLTDTSFKQGIWSKREVSGEQTLFYSVDVIKDSYTKVDSLAKAQILREVDLEEPITQAAKEILDNIYKKSADNLTFTSLLIQEFNKTNPSQAVRIIKNNFMKTSKEKRNAILHLLNFRDIKINALGVLELEDKKRNVPIKQMLEVFHKDKWYLFDIDKGLISDTSNYFIWNRGSKWLLDAEGVKNSKVRFSISKNIVSARQAALSKDIKDRSTLVDFSLFSLPNTSQNAFKSLLLVPLGALVVVLMRVFVGLKTSGTFMPILLAMAFIETSLIPGIMMFILVVTMGLVIRSYLSHLNLLLVARISSVVIVVVGIMAFVAIMSQKLNLEYSTSITFFPMIILAWTIERMSIIWEEEGPKEVIQQGSGSLIIAILAYFAMTNSTLSFITFNFPEVLLAVLGLIILLGRYSGYRLSELYRFKSMV